MLFRERPLRHRLRATQCRRASRSSSSFDRRLITQAVTNLVKNARRRSQACSESAGQGAGLEAAASRPIVRRNGDRVDIEVIDNGIGLPKQNRARLLEPYVTTKGHKGTGLGLAIVQKIIEQHGGTLSLEDAPPAPGRDARRARPHHPAARQRARRRHARTTPHSPTEQAAAQQA